MQMLYILCMFYYLAVAETLWQASDTSLKTLHTATAHGNVKMKSMLCTARLKVLGKVILGQLDYV